MFSRSTPLTEKYSALSRQLRDGGKQAPAHLLPPVVALQEVAAVAGAVMEGRPVFAGDRKSLKIDVVRSLKELGPELEARVAAPVKAFLHDDVARLLEDGAGARIAVASAQKLLTLFASADAADAAWRDCVTAFEADATAGVCELRIAQLRGIVELRGHDWEQHASRLAGVVNDFYYELKRAGAELEGEPKRLSESAGVPIEERLKLCRGLVRESPSAGTVAVWLVFANADLGTFYVKRDAIEFFNGLLWGAVRSGDWRGAPPRWERPPEFDDDGADLFFNGMPKENFVVVRVRLVGVPIGTARPRARELATGIGELASMRSGWRLMLGEAAHVEGSGWFGAPRFTDPVEQDELELGNPGLDPTGEWLAELDERMVAAYVAGEREAIDLVDAVRWRVATMRIPVHAQRLALDVRSLERHLVPTTAGAADETKWYDAAKRYLLYQWCLRQVGRDIFDATFHGVHALPDRWQPAPRPLSDRFRRALIEEQGMGFRIHTGEAIRQAPALAAEMTGGSMERRMLDELAVHTASGTTARAWLKELEDVFERLFARTRRQRNAVVHGAETVPAVIASVETFVADLSSLLIGATFAAVVERRSLLVELQFRRDEALQMLERLEAGEEPAVVLAPND